MSRTRFPALEGNSSFWRLLAIALSAAILAVFSPCFAQDWEIECVHCPKYFSRMTDRSLQVDSIGRPHVAYGGDHLYYSWWDGAAWIHETVDDEPSVGERAALAFDPSGSPHICYVDTKTGAIRHAYRGACGWEIEVVVESGYPGYRALAFAISDPAVLHIGFCEGQYLKCAWKAGAEWSFETVVDQGFSDSGQLSLATNDCGNIAIGYAGASGLECARRDSAGWVIHELDAHSGNSSVCFGENGDVHMSYCHWQSTEALCYARIGADGVALESVDTGSGVGYYSSIAYSGTSGVQIAYWDWANKDLKHAERLASGWSSHTVQSDDDTGRYPSAAVDCTGGVHFAYLQEGPTMAARYGRRDQYGYHLETICGGGALDGEISLAVAPDGGPHMSWVDGYWTWSSVMYAQKIEYLWRQEVVSVASSSNPGENSLAIGGDGVPHIGFVSDEIGNRRVRHSWRTSECWDTEVIASVYDTYVFRLGLAVGSALRPSAVWEGYYSGQEGVYEWVEYASCDESGWDSGHIDYYDAREPSFTLDRAGDPHVIYEKYAAGMRYAHLDSAGWHIEQLPHGSYPCIALDEMDNPYVTDSGPRLEFYWKDGSEWRYQDVGPASSLPGTPAPLGVDRQGRVHVAFRGPEGYLRYALRTSGVWHIQTIDAGYDLAEHVSLALGPDGSVHIGYSDGGNRDVKYARHSPLGSVSPGWSSSSDLTLRIEGPCPSTGVTPLGLFLAKPSPANVSVFDLGGRRVRIVTASPLPEGTHRLIWDGLDDRGLRVPSGTYICSAEAGDARASTRVVLIR